MFLLKDRNTTYYARYCFSNDLIKLGFPTELRFSLSTKKRAEAIDRLMVIMSHIRGYVSTWDGDGNIPLTIQRLRSELKVIRQRNFCPVVHAPLLPVEPVLPVLEVKPLVSKHQINKRLFDDFIRSKKVENILPRTIQQLESRIKAFIKSSKMNALEATTKHAMNFRDELLRAGKAEKSVIEYLAAVRQFYKWLRLRGDIDKNIFEDVTVKKNLAEPQKIDKDGLNLICTSCSNTLALYHLAKLLCAHKESLKTTGCRIYYSIQVLVYPKFANSIQQI